MSSLTIAIVVAFCIGYFFIAVESVTKVNKAAVALLMFVVCWTIFMVDPGSYLTESAFSIPLFSSPHMLNTWTLRLLWICAGALFVTDRAFWHVAERRGIFLAKLHKHVLHHVSKR